MTQNRSRLTCRGFSLLELLSAIVIVSVVAGFLVGVVNRASEKSATTKCLSNLRQYKIAWDLYATDHQDEFPPDGNGDTNPTWWQSIKRWNPDALPVYRLQCPANPDLAVINRTQPELYQRFTYAYNAHLGASQVGGIARQTMRRTRVKNHHEFPLFLDGKIVSSVGRLRYHWGPEIGFHEIGFWHRNQAHVLFLDGHVQSFPNTQEGHQAIKAVWDKFWRDYARVLP